eukprot:5382952-Amphidinium_carterae.1
MRLCRLALSANCRSAAETASGRNDSSFSVLSTLSLCLHLICHSGQMRGTETSKVVHEVSSWGVTGGVPFGVQNALAGCGRMQT